MRLVMANATNDWLSSFPPAVGNDACPAAMTASAGPPLCDLASRGRFFPKKRDGPGEATFDLDVVFAGLADAPGLLLAVSGGPDSMALMLLAARWAARPGAAPVHVATVDHGLRAESPAEAKMVARAAAAVGLQHDTLVWDGTKPSSRVQERARAARYALLAAHAHVLGASHILTAHHADDQAETVMMRLGRGSGIGGLAGMRRATPLGPGLILLRPLLDRPKIDLVALCRDADMEVLDDPSNSDRVFLRARLRADAGARAALGLDTIGLTRLARRMAQADAALEAEAARVEASLVFVHDDDGIRASLAPLIAIQPEILLRVLRRMIEKISVRPTIRLDRLETLTVAVAVALREGRPYCATLGGTRLAIGRDTMIRIAAEGLRRRGTPSPRG